MDDRRRASGDLGNPDGLDPRGPDPKGPDPKGPKYLTIGYLDSPD